MTLPRLLAKALNSATSPAERRFFNPRIILQSSLYSTTTKPTKSYFKKQPSKFAPSISPPPPPLSEAKKAANLGIDYPRPSEIPWQAKVANLVNLTGYVAKPVKFLEFRDDGKAWASTVLTQDKPAGFQLWIPLIFEGDLAHVAACHVKENDFVHISGQLSGNPTQFTTEQGQTSIQVMVNSLDFVQETLQRKESQTSYKQKEVTRFSSQKDSTTADHLWNDLLANPQDWWDNRLKKNNSSGVDFKHMDSGELRIDESTPGWIVAKLDSLNFINKTENLIKKTELKSDKSVKDSKYPWRDLVENPNQWLDCRKIKQNGKVSPKYPDFKRKDGVGEALWLYRVPEWVESELKQLKFDDAVIKTSQPKESKDDIWKSLVEDPSKWWDNRSKKANSKHPDFRNKETGEALWLDSSPAWVSHQLPPVKI